MATGRKTGSALAGLLMTAASHAYASCSEAADPDDAGVVILRCEGVVIAAEATAVRSPVTLMSSHPHAIQLDAGAIAVSSNASASRFTALTPDAVASALDGEWAVLAEAGGTRASSWRGSVSVRQRMDGTERVFRAEAAESDALDPGRAERLRRALQRSLKRP